MHNKAFLINRLVNAKLKGANTIVERLSDFQDIVNQSSISKLVFGEELHVLFLLNSLLDSGKTLVVIVSNSALGDKLYLSMVNDRLFNEEALGKEMGVDINQILVTERRGRSNSRGPRGKEKPNNICQRKGRTTC